jgi:hypothetical protein
MNRQVCSNFKGEILLINEENRSVLLSSGKEIKRDSVISMNKSRLAYLKT